MCDHILQDDTLGQKIREHEHRWMPKLLGSSLLRYRHKLVRLDFFTGPPPRV